MNTEITKNGMTLDQQVCFPFYAASHLITRIYRPHLEKLGITYPQYLVLLLLWEKDERSVTEISDQLYLNTNTVTPLLKRMESEGWVSRNRNTADERKVWVYLTDDGKALREKASSLPMTLFHEMDMHPAEIPNLQHLCSEIHLIMDKVSRKLK